MKTSHSPGAVPQPETRVAPCDAAAVSAAVPRALARHAGPLVLFALLAYALTAPVWSAPDRTVLGAGLGDNASAIWNFWWSQSAWQDARHSLFWTDAIVAPIGTSLVLHSSAWLPIAASAVAWPDGNPVTLYNAWIALSLFLNGFCAYLLCHRLTGHRGASLFGGLVFGLAPFLVVRVQGHLNVLCAWVLPLVAFAAEPLWRRASLARGLFAGIVLGLAAYVDYYYFIFGAVLLIVLAATHIWQLHVARAPLTTRRRRIARCLVGLTLIMLGLVIVVWITGGGDTRILGLTVRMRGTFNLRLFAWLLGLAAAMVWFAPRLTLVREPHRTDVTARDLLVPWIGVAAAALVVVAPLVIAGLQLWLSGDYASPRYLWRSAPPGIDLAALLLGNPTGTITAGASQAAYARFGIDDVESVAWLGLLPTLLTLIAMRRAQRTREVRRWLTVLAIFGVWALGPYLTIFGANTAFMLPQTAIRFLPIIANARMPGRAFVVVLLAVAILSAMVLATHHRFRGRGRLALAVALLMLDFWPAPYAVTRLDSSPSACLLATLPPGIVMNLPMGLRDGFGVLGDLDHHTLYDQTVHEHATTGGFVARLSARTRQRYESDPVFGRMLSLSSADTGASASTRRDTPVTGNAADSLACSVRYLSISDQASPELLAFTRSVFVPRLLVKDATRALYIVDAFQPPFCAPQDAPAP